MTTEPVDPFEADLFRRGDVAKKLTPFLAHLKGGGTIGIDANYGEGKSWFGCAWSRQLRKDGHKVAYIDAFAHDYVDDPFLLVAAELSVLLEDGNPSRRIAERAGAVMRSVAPLGKR